MSLLRRLLSILLLAAFGLPFIAAALPLAQSGDSRLPACCRRNGAHHCAMSALGDRSAIPASSEEPAWKAPAERCPYWPAPGVSSTPHHAPPQPDAYGLAARFGSPIGTAQMVCRHRIACDRSTQRRGPPYLAV
ncbi:MAG: hypothetical protein M3O02_09490 [Acidobacteriota bacterium]|nr:hypothetical protein [Acidobacteriota bacterium]